MEIFTPDVLALCKSRRLHSPPDRDRGFWLRDGLGTDLRCLPGQRTTATTGTLQTLSGHLASSAVSGQCPVLGVLASSLLARIKDGCHSTVVRGHRYDWCPRRDRRCPDRPSLAHTCQSLPRSRGSLLNRTTRDARTSRYWLADSAVVPGPAKLPQPAASATAPARVRIGCRPGPREVQTKDRRMARSAMNRVVERRTAAVSDS